MQFVQGLEGWQLVTDDAHVLATLRSEIEVLALRQFCLYFHANPHAVPEHFTIDHAGVRHTVTPLGQQGECLTLLIAGADGRRSTVETRLVLRQDACPVVDPPTEPPPPPS